MVRWYLLRHPDGREVRVKSLWKLVGYVLKGFKEMDDHEYDD